MSLYFARGAAASLESKHYKKNANGVSKHEQAWSSPAAMPNGFPGFPQNTFPNEKPPTLFHPASPKIKASKPTQEVDAASMMSTSTFASNVSLLKENVKAKFHSKDKSARNEKKTSTARQDTAEAYRIIAATKH